MPGVKPEPYHGSVSHAANYRGVASSGYSPSGLGGTSATGSQNYEMITPSGMFGGGYSMATMPPPGVLQQSPFMLRYGAGFGSYLGGGAASMYSPMAALTPKGLIGGPSVMPDRHRGPLPYALVPASSFPFGK